MTPTPPDRPAYWGQGLPAPGTDRRPGKLRAAFQVVWTLIWSLVLLACMTIGWLAFPFNLLGAALCVGAILAFRSATPPPPQPVMLLTAQPPAHLHRPGEGEGR
jgi:hypothetical protein